MKLFSLSVLGVFFLFQGTAQALNPVAASAAAQGPCPPGYMVYNSSSDGFCCRKLPPPPPPTPTPVQASNGPCCKMVSNPSPVVNCSIPPYNTPVNTTTMNSCVKAGNGRSCYWDASHPECRMGNPSTTGGQGSNTGSDNNRRCCQGSSPACSAIDSIPVPSASFPSIIDKFNKCRSSGVCNWNPACALP